MTVKLAGKTPCSAILFTSEGLGKFNFKLRAEFSGEPDRPGECRVQLDGDLNPFIVQMAQKPLTTLVDTMAVRLSEL
jgi:hypothetical protein